MSEHGKFNEATRVQMPALVHLTRLGYNYYGKISEESVGKVYDGDTNILLEVFKSQFEKLNPDHAGEYEQVLHDIKQELDYDDLGRSFYKRLTSINDFQLYLPSINEQERISKILTDIDRKIENNTCINDNLANYSAMVA